MRRTAVVHFGFSEQIKQLFLLAPGDVHAVSVYLRQFA